MEVAGWAVLGAVGTVVAAKAAAARAVEGCVQDSIDSNVFGKRKKTLSMYVEIQECICF